MVIFCFLLLETAYHHFREILEALFDHSSIYSPSRKQEPCQVMSFFVLFNPIPVESAEGEELFMKISCLYTLKVKDS